MDLRDHPGSGADPALPRAGGSFAGRCLWPSLAVALTLWLFGPATIYFTNQAEFGFLFQWIAGSLLAAAGISWLLLSGLLALLPHRFSERAAALLLALAFLFWLQGNFLVWPYGLLDGHPIPWERLALRGVIDGLAWLAVLGLAGWRPQRLVRHAGALCLLLLLVQAAWMGVAAARAPDEDNRKHLAFDDRSKFEFSGRRNVILLVLDSMQADVFGELLREHPGLSHAFRGFTWYRDTLAAAHRTHLAVPAILTGKNYDNSRPLPQYLQEAYLSPASLPKALRERGYRVELYPALDYTVHFSPAVASNLKPRSGRRAVAGEVGLLLDISLFRQLPHVLKPLVYRNQKWLLKGLLARTGRGDARTEAPEAAVGRRFSPEALALPDVQFIRRMLATARAEGDTPVFKYFHLNGAHTPFQLNENLDFQPLPHQDRENFKTQSRAALEIARLFLDKLRAINQYAPSLILVMGDHGSTDYDAPVSPDGGPPETGGAPAVPPNYQAAGLALLLAKPAGADGEPLRVSDAPVSLTDVPRSVLEGLGLEAAGGGESIFSMKPDRRRRRTFHVYYYHDDDWSRDFLKKIDVYAVTGHSWRSRSWRRENELLPPRARTKMDDACRYTPGTVLGFAADGNSAPHRGDGWFPEPGADFSWTSQTVATLRLRVPPPRSDLELRILAWPFLQGTRTMQKVYVHVNDRRVGLWRMLDPAPALHRMTIPRDLVTVNGWLVITFRIPTAVDMSADGGVKGVGMAVRSLVVRETPRG